MPRIDITITNADGQTATLSQAFEFQAAAPVVESVDPTSGPIAGGTEVKINGQNFQVGGSVTFGGRLAPIVSVSPTQIVVITPDMR